MLWSVAAHVLAVAALLLLPAPLPKPPSIQPPRVRVLLLKPPRPLETPPVRRIERVARLDLPVAKEPPPAPRKVTAPEAPRLEMEANPSLALPLDQPRLEQPKPDIAPAAATASAPQPRQATVRSAGFEGAPVQAAGPSRAARLNVGSFRGLSGAPGGSPGAGRKAEVRQAGFGGALTATATGKAGPTVAAGGFGGAVAANGTRTRPAPTASAGFEQVRGEKAEARLERPKAEPDVMPVEVVSKPKPAYTAEARERRIEGEVALRVRFGADGRAEVLKVLRGLGYGLDEAAAHAVEAMQFRPALRAGTPVDSVLSVAVAFRLAY